MRPRARSATQCARCTATTSRAPSSRPRTRVSPLVPILLIAAVAALALLLRASAGRDGNLPRPAAGGDDAHADDSAGGGDDDDDDEAEEGMGAPAAITSDGWGVVPRGVGGEPVPPGEDDEMLADPAQRPGA